MAETKNESIVESTELKDEKALKSGQDNEIFWRVRPYFSMDFNDATGEFNARVELPGVSKEHVKLRVLPDLFELKATTGHTQYTLCEYFPYEMNVDTIDAKYEHGLLVIKGKFKDPLDNAVQIKIE
nr:Hsp20/alpha crystallin family protein [Candidatus Sigynarchaeota archaeon]